MATRSDVRKIALSFPEVKEKEGHFAFEVLDGRKYKGFAWVWMERIDPKKARVPNAGVLAVRVPDLDAKEMSRRCSRESNHTARFETFAQGCERRRPSTPGILRGVGCDPAARNARGARARSLSACQAAGIGMCARNRRHDRREETDMQANAWKRPNAKILAACLVGIWLASAPALKFSHAATPPQHAQSATARNPETAMTRNTEQVIRIFLDEVRSGRNPDMAGDVMAPKVLAHQITAENPETVERSPQNYADHIREMKSAYGDYRLTVTELLVQGERAYVRWEQTGKHIGEVEGFSPTGLEVTELASAVYRVVDGKIVEYWVQIDRTGLAIQLQRNAVAARSKSER